jgi:hypothetical protein
VSGAGGYPPPLTVGEVKHLAAQGHDHHGGCLTSTRARELDASIEEAISAAYERGKRDGACAALGLSPAGVPLLRTESQD